MTMGWPSVAAIGSATSRAQTSVAPPGGSGTMQRMGQSGQLRARTGVARRAGRKGLRIMSSLFFSQPGMAMAF